MFQLRHPARQLLIGRRQLCDPRLPRLAARDQLRDPHGLHPDERDQIIAGQTIQTGHEQIKATLRPAPSTDTPTTPRNPPPPVAVTDRYQQAATDTLRAGTECLPLKFALEIRHGPRNIFSHDRSLACALAARSAV